MIRNLYTPSAAEKWIIDTYHESGIKHPDQLTIDAIASIWSIDIIYSKTPCSFAQWDTSTAKIYLPCTYSLADQRSSFFHELSHILLHEGNQRKMPKLFRDLQERQADRFRLYASMPYPMIKPLLDHSPTEIAEEFKITVDLVSKRLNQIANRINANKELFFNTDIKPVSTQQKTKWSEETIKVMHQLNRILLNKQHYRYYGT